MSYRNEWSYVIIPAFLNEGAIEWMTNITFNFYAYIYIHRKQEKELNPHSVTLYVYVVLHTFYVYCTGYRVKNICINSLSVKL